MHSWNTSGWPTPEGSALFPVLSVDNGGLLETQNLGNGFGTLSRLTEFTHFASQLFLNLFGSWHEVFVFEILYWSFFTLTDRLYLSEFLIEQVRVWPVAFSNNVVNHSFVMI